MIVDLLVHIDSADGALVEPERLIEAAKAAGLDGLVLSQTGVLAPELAPYRAAGEEAGVRIFAGAVLTTDHGLILAVMPPGVALDPATVEADDGVCPAAAAIDAVEGAGGVTVALRPYDRDVSHPMGDHLFSLQGLDACEVRSGRVAEIANDLALEAASNLEMPCVGSSAARGTEGLGTAATLLRRPAADEGELIDLIKRGACWPVAFSDELPREAREERRGGRSRSEGRRSEGRRRGDGERPARSERKDRGGRGRSRGRGGKKEGGTRVTSAPDHADRLPDDVGNRARRHDDDRPPPDDIGNRLRPGETSPFHDALRRGDD